MCFLRTLATIAAAIVLPNQALLSQQRSLSDFLKKDVEAQRDFINDTYRKRMIAHRNVSFNAVTQYANHQYSKGKIGALLVRFSKEVITYRQIDRSYYFKCVTFDSSSGKQLMHLENHYDASAGINRGLVTHQGKKPSGAIMNTEDGYLTYQRFMYWVNDSHKTDHDSVFKHIIENLKNAVFTLRENRLHLTFPWTTTWSGEPIGEKDYILDPDKDFLPVQGRLEWSRPHPNGKPFWRRENFTVRESEQIDGVWLPTSLFEIIESSTLGDGKATVYETKVQGANFGKLKLNDIQVKFPSGIKVVDSIRGQVYEVGANETLTYYDKLYPVMPPSNEIKSKSSNFWLFIISAAILITLAVVSVYYLRRRNRS